MCFSKQKIANLCEIQNWEIKIKVRQLSIWTSVWKKESLVICAVKLVIFTPNVKSVLNENIGGILGGTQC
jgi:hypothetical protein